MLAQSQIFALPSKETTAFESVGFEGQYRKELIPVGSFQDANHTRVEVTEDRVHHWKKTFDKYVQAGNKVPAPLGHTLNPEYTRGFWDKFSVERNSRGGTSLFGYIKLDEENERLAQSEVSIYAEGEHFVGGEHYEDVILHVCFTDYPMIPGMDGAQRVMCSWTGSSTSPKDTDVNKQEILNKYNIELDEGQTVDEAFDELIAAGVKSVYASDDEVVEDDDDDDDDDEGDDEGDTEVSPAEEEAALAMSSQVASLTLQNRGHQIDKLVTDRKITPAQAKSLRKRFCTKGTQLSALAKDGFDGVIEFASLGTPLSSKGERVAAKKPGGSEGGGGKRLADMAKVKAERAAAKRQR